MYQYLLNAFSKFKNSKLYICQNWISHYFTHKKDSKDFPFPVKMHFPPAGGKWKCISLGNSRGKSFPLNPELYPVPSNNSNIVVLSSFYVEVNVVKRQRTFSKKCIFQNEGLWRIGPKNGGTRLEPKKLNTIILRFLSLKNLNWSCNILNKAISGMCGRTISRQRAGNGKKVVFLAGKGRETGIKIFYI